MTIEPLTIGITMVDLVMQLFALISCSHLMKKEEKVPALAFTLLTILMVWLATRELPQYWSTTFYRYTNDPSNWLDFSQLIILIVTLVLHDEVHPTLLITSILVSWLRLVFVLGDMFFSISVFVNALLQVSGRFAR